MLARYLKKALLKIFLLMTLHCMDITHKFYISNLSWLGKNATTDNCLYSLRNLLIACLFSLKEKVQDYTPSNADDSLIFIGVFQYSYQRLCFHIHPNFHRPHVHCVNFNGTYLLPVGSLYFLEHLFHVDLYVLQNQKET